MTTPVAPETFPLFDTAIKVMDEFKTSQVEPLNHPPLMQAFRKLKYGRFALANSEFSQLSDKQIEILNLVIWRVGLRLFLSQDVTPAIKQKVDGQNFSLTLLDGGHGHQKVFLMFADTAEPLHIVQPAKLRQKIQEIKEAFLGGEIDNEWKKATLKCVGKGMTADISKPTYAKAVSIDPEIGEEIIHLLGNFYGVPLMHSTVGGFFHVVADAETLQFLQEKENVRKRSFPAHGHGASSYLQ